ncbi:MAG: hypothetical protein QGH60_15735 [Phycisphaerae bacterium]|nr:hypothetical protein [Phycisphaerae bacterium]
MSEDRDKIEELLSAYIDGEATPEQSRSIEQAVARDPELALELHELTATKRLVTDLSKERAPRGFVRKVMARAERKHLLGDHQAGGAFSAARWITLAVAAVVLLTAGVGIIAINMLGTGQGPLHVANRGEIGPDPGGSAGVDMRDGSLHGKGSDSGKVGGDWATVGDGIRGGKIIVADEALDLAVANARNTSVYTHDVSNTVAVLHETFSRNGVLPLDLETPGRDFKADDTIADTTADQPAGTVTAKDGAEEQNVSRGALNFYYNKKQDDEQVQIVVLATDTVIEQLNGDIDKLARVQMVSQAPASDLYKARSDLGYMARRAGPRPRQGAKKDTEPENRDEGEVTIARVDNDNTGLGVVSGVSKAGKGDGTRAKSKVVAKGTTDQPGIKKAPAPAVTPPKTVKPTVDPSVFGGDNNVRPSDVTGAGTSVAVGPTAKPPGTGVSQTGKAAAPKALETATADPDGKKYELADKAVGTLKTAPARPAPAKRSVGGPTSRPADPVQVAGRIQIQQDILDNKNTGELEALSSQIAKQQKRGDSNKELDLQYSKLNNAFRQQIWNDNVRRNVQSQQARGLNIQALVININHRGLRSRGRGTTRQRDDKALTRPGATTTPARVSESTTQRAAQQPADTSR